MPDPTSSSSLATSCRPARSRCRRRTTRIPRTSAPRWTGCSRGNGSAPAQRAGRARRVSLRSRGAGRERHRHAARPATRAGVLQRLPSSRHTPLHRGDGHVSPAASSARITPGRTPSTAAWSARRTWTSAALPTRTITLCIAVAATSGTATCSSTWPTSRRRSEQLADLPRSSPLAHAGPPARPPHRLRREGQLEADRPELQRVPALPQPASGAQPLSHYLSGENEPLTRPTWAAGWICGRCGDDVDGWDVPAGDAAGAD